MTEKHIHKYVRKVIGRKGFTVYQCVKPGCSHFIRMELVEGREAECWRCGRQMVMTKKASTLKKPHCAECTREATGAAGQWGV